MPDVNRSIFDETRSTFGETRHLGPTLAIGAVSENGGVSVVICPSGMKAIIGGHASAGFRYANGGAIYDAVTANAPTSDGTDCFASQLRGKVQPAPCASKPADTPRRPGHHTRPGRAPGIHTPGRRAHQLPIAALGGGSAPAIRLPRMAAAPSSPPGDDVVAGDGAFSTMDLTARHPRIGELLSTVMFMLQTLAAAGELQRELNCDGLRAARDQKREGQARR
ncbi:hypothetical protein [Streptomyces rubiginosohelvolus]|uniref:hypothetical protein n=1 Tax=Streptomyces rubiginosohelvolus TaxID=67362 RepID=UPI0035E32962